MIILDTNKKEMLINKLMFMLSFIITTNKDFEEIFDVRVIDTNENDVSMFELKFKKVPDIFIYFKRLFNGNIEIRYVATTTDHDTKHIDEVTLKFLTGLVDDGVEYCEFLGTAEVIFGVVTEIEKERQFQKLNDTMNDLINY